MLPIAFGKSQFVGWVGRRRAKPAIGQAVGFAALSPPYGASAKGSQNGLSTRTPARLPRTFLPVPISPISWPAALRGTLPRGRHVYEPRALHRRRVAQRRQKRRRGRDQSGEREGAGAAAAREHGRSRPRARRGREGFCGLAGQIGL